jgi:NDP-sugar pyrophosphorylase family protein
MKPPKETNVIHRAGFTILSRKKTWSRDDMRREWKETGDTLWRNAGVLIKSRRLKDCIGVLQEYDEKSFFQNNNDVTKAIYKVKGYGYRVVLWFDNKTGERIA